MASSDSRKHSNLCYLLVEGGTKVSRALFFKLMNAQMPPGQDPDTWTVDAFLLANKSKLLASRAGRDKEYILFPRSGGSNHERWDLSILCVIILEACNIDSVLRMYLQQLQKLRNKILHLNTTDIADNKFEHYLTKLTVILSKCLAEINDEQLSSDINAVIEKSSGGSIPENDLTQVMQAVHSSQETTRQQLEKLDRFETANSEKLDILIGMVKNLDDKFEHAVEVPDVGVTIIVKNCTEDKIKAISNSMVQTFNEVIERDQIDFDELSNEWKHRIQEAVYQTCVLFWSKGHPIAIAEERCVLLNIRCVSLESLLMLFKAYIQGKLDDMLWVLEAAITSGEGYEDISLEAVMYKDEFWAVLSKIVSDLDTCVSKEKQLRPPSRIVGKPIPIEISFPDLVTQTYISPENKMSPPDIRPSAFETVKQLEPEESVDVQYSEGADAVDKTGNTCISKPENEELRDDNSLTPGREKIIESVDKINVRKTDEYPPGILVAAAIDIGTSCTGYAYAFRDNPSQIFLSTWDSQTEEPSEVKAPTTALFDPRGVFVGFGFAAEKKYSELLECGDHHSWYYFRKFKMDLYQNKKLSKGMMLKEEGDKEMPAMTVFTAVIRFLKERVLDDIRRKLPYLEENDILWVLTVPALWSDAAKQFMRVSAANAGIPDQQLKLVLEAEAASLYCQMGEFQYQESDKMFPPGLRYIIADLGGGTTDIATHEVLEDGSLREIYRPSGGSFAGDCVNVAFQTFLADLVGDEVLRFFQATANGEFLELKREFEKEKRNLKADASNPIRIKCPATFFECVKDRRKKTLCQCIEEKGFSKIVKIEDDIMTINPELIKIFFNETIEEICGSLKEIIRSVNNIQQLFLVGGFSASPYVKESLTVKLKNEFQDLEIVQPKESNIHVLKGAVLTCLKPNHITERVSRFTYGFRIAEPFDEDKHPAMLKDIRASGEEYCSDIFLKFIEVGQVMKFGDKVKFEFGGKRLHETSKHESYSTEIYRSTFPNPRFCTPDEKCERIGRIIHTPPKEGWHDVLNFTTEIEIGDTEFQITVADNDTSKIYSKKIEFLDDE